VTGSEGGPARETSDFSDPKWQASFKGADLLERFKKPRDRAASSSAAGLSDERIEAIVAHVAPLNCRKK